MQETYGIREWRLNPLLNRIMGILITTSNNSFFYLLIAGSSGYVPLPIAPQVFAGFSGDYPNGSIPRNLRSFEAAKQIPGEPISEKWLYMAGMSQIAFPLIRMSIAYLSHFYS